MRFNSKNFPTSPGVYLMKDATGRILYIGKAKNLQKRVKSYLTCRRHSTSHPEQGEGSPADGRYQIKFLMDKVESIDFVKTDTEKEAVLLEYKLIQQHKPKYNLDLKDSKTFMRIAISNHAFPAIFVTRNIKKGHAKYFGPYTSAATAREMVEYAVKFFRLRTCSDREFLNRSRPCIQYDIGHCTAPCAGYVTKDKYAGQVARAELFLKGLKKDLLSILRTEMKTSSNAQNYEVAVQMRDLIKNVRLMWERQKVMSPTEVVGRGYDDKSENIYNKVTLCLCKALHLRTEPHVIECVDISNIQGRAASGAVVSFIDGAPFKSRYRLFNIQLIGKPNDYAMMFEVLKRRYKHEQWGVPDLLLVDGGRGQLSIAIKALHDLDVLTPIVAIAKIKGSHKKSSDEAMVFLPNRVNPVKFRRGDPALLYLIRIRDEAHRFGISHYRRRHVKLGW